jgi:hypothetical protein
MPTFLTLLYLCQSGKKHLSHTGSPTQDPQLGSLTTI